MATTIRTFTLTQGQSQSQRLQVFSQKLLDQRVRILAGWSLIFLIEGEKEPVKGRSYILDHQLTNKQGDSGGHLHIRRVDHRADQISVGKNKGEGKVTKRQLI